MRFCIVIASFAALAIAISLICLLVIAYFSQHHVIRAAQPEFIVIIVLGSILCYISVYCWLYCVTDAGCTALPWLVTTGFSLMFGALFVKTLKLYAILRHVEEYRSVRVPTWQLASTLGGLLLLEWGLLIAWTIVDPLHQKIVFPDPLRPKYDLRSVSHRDCGYSAAHHHLDQNKVFILVQKNTSFSTLKRQKMTWMSRANH